MKKLMISMSILALFFASCGDASSEASSESNDDNNTTQNSESDDYNVESNEANS